MLNKTTTMDDASEFDLKGRTDVVLTSSGVLGVPWEAAFGAGECSMGISIQTSQAASETIEICFPALVAGGLLPILP